ncbi:MAG TPA: carboxypeptidase-like regulatory domain-containing protein [Chryseosolibacter sp.]
MRKHAFTFILTALVSIMAGFTVVHGQELIQGIVVDSATLNALPSVSIQLKNSSRGTSTDEKGNFSIRATAADTLIFTSVGYQTLELPLSTYEPGMIRLSETYTLLKAITIDEYKRTGELYEGMFDDRNAQLQKSIPFYFSRARKDRIRLGMLKEENLRVKTYMDVVVNNPELKESFMTKYALNEREYYDILTAFNETHYEVMYYLTAAELISLLNRFFESHAPGH